MRGSAWLLKPRPGVPSLETILTKSQMPSQPSVLPRGQSPRLRLGRPGPGSAGLCAALSRCPLSFRFHTTHAGRSWGEWKAYLAPLSFIADNTEVQEG